MAEKKIIALAGNPNSGKTTLFNALTGANQFVGNWPGVTVEKKEGKLKKHSDVIITDLPGIYSLSPYTLEEVVARNYLIDSSPDAILNIIDGSNLERNLYLTTQLLEIGLPVVIAINMMDVVRKNGDKIDIEKLSLALGCPVVEISALKNEGIDKLVNAAIEAASTKAKEPEHIFSGIVEHAIAHIEEECLHHMPSEKQRWFAIKIFERDEKIIEKLGIKEKMQHVENDIVAAEKEMDDDAESIITGERYVRIKNILDGIYEKKRAGQMTISDKIDQVVTNRILALPIFVAVMFVVYYLSITTVGTMCTDWVNDNLFGAGWRVLGIGTAEYEQAVEAYAVPGAEKEAFEAALDEAGLKLSDPEAKNITAEAVLHDDNGEVTDKIAVDYNEYKKVRKIKEPAPEDYGTFVPSIPDLVGGGLDAINCAPWLRGLIIDGIIGGVGAVLGFLPQMLVLFLLLAILEGCGYMARIAFVMDRIFRKFGLSGKSFIPMLIGTGCSVPGILASRTIESENDRRTTIITTSFMPCGAKLPIIALISGALFGNAAWVTTSAYFAGIVAIIVSGIILKKTKLFAGDPAPFVMELPPYHVPTVINVLRSMWERGSAFVKKAGTIILVSAILLWFLMNFGFENGFGMVDNLNNSILAKMGNLIAWIFIPMGFGDWRAAVATITGLIAKENVVGTFGVLYGGFDTVAANGWQIWDQMRMMFTPLSGYAFLLFNLLCAPCFAAIGAIRREMNDTKWTWIAVGYQCGLAYVVSLIFYQIGMAFTGNANPVGLAVAVILLAGMLYLLFRPTPKERKTTK